MTAQEILDEFCKLYAAFYFQDQKGNLQFDAMEYACIIMEKARAAGLKTNVDIRNPDIPKIDLPLFSALD